MYNYKVEIMCNVLRLKIKLPIFTLSPVNPIKIWDSPESVSVLFNIPDTPISGSETLAQFYWIFPDTHPPIPIPLQSVIVL